MCKMITTQRDYHRIGKRMCARSRGLVLSGITAVLLISACKQHESIPVASMNDGEPKTASEEQAGDSAHRCRPPSPAVAPGTRPVAARDLVGDYILTVVAVRGAGRDSVVTGRLVLHPTSTAPQVPHSPASYPLSGWSDVDLKQLGRVSLAYPASSTDPIMPGVQAIYDSMTSAYSLVFGNAISSRGVREDAGVYFDLTDVSPRGFRGTWKDGGRIAPLPQGYFCAHRAGSTANDEEQRSGSGAKAG